MTSLFDAARACLDATSPDAKVAATGLPGFTDARWWRDAFDGCVAYGFFPQREMDFFEAAPLVHGKDERIPVSDLGFAASAYVSICRELLG